MKKQRFHVAALAPVVVGALAFLSGCGSDAKNETVVDSPAAQKANAAGTDAMREAMQAKAKHGKASAKP